MLDSPAAYENLLKRFDTVSNEFQTKSILKNRSFFKIISKSLFSKYLVELSGFYDFMPRILTKLSYHKIKKAITILKVLESLLKKIQTGKLSLKNANKMIKQSNIYLSKSDLGTDTFSNSKTVTLNTLQSDFLDAIDINITNRQSLFPYIRELSDVGLAMRFIRYLDYLLDLRMLISSSYDWDSANFKSKFDSVKLVGLGDPFKVFVKDLFVSSSFELKIKAPTEMMMCSVDNHLYNERLFAVRRLKR